MKIVNASLDYFKKNEDFQFQVELENGQDLDLVGYVSIRQDDDIFFVEVLQVELIDPNTSKIVNIDLEDEDLADIEEILNNNIDIQLEEENRVNRMIDFAIDCAMDREYLGE